ncbi:glycoside hydrolase/deacetylase [Neocallimastix californiae]|uniref:Glycoside hydrolase/deacetylase n=1 Tax=Neocallimastix californiae TaxID=1754190 RepID=A0A1Y2AT65_9FUNG|nr:glycoside hydrolase/deacetylase [Neocallimastix californiae]|eukprot:ORY25135.1 glycoside hydrolase/deacetylase [Neocallimastix californiae]
MKAISVIGILSACLVGYTRAACGEAFAQCGGNNYDGEVCCVAGTECEYVNESYSQCNPVEDSSDDDKNEAIVDVDVTVENDEDSTEESDNENEKKPQLPKGTGIQYFEKCKNPKHWAMTYDDGPTEYADLMLDLFKKYDIKVTFFICEFKRIIKRMYDEGHVIGNHTYNHLNLVDLTPDEIVNEMKLVEDPIYEIIGKRPAFVRLPFGSGASEEKVMNTLESLGYHAAINWNVDTMDWDNTGSIDYSNKVITEKLGQPLITLNHLAFDGVTKENIAALAEFEIQYILSQGYTPVTMDECLGIQAYQ